MEAVEHPENSIYRHLYLRKFENLYYEKKEYAKAEKYSLQYLSTLVKYKLDTTVYYDVALNNLANNYAKLQRYNDALKLYRQSLATAKKRWPLNDKAYMITITNISETYGLMGNVDSAMVVLESYKDKLKDQYGEEDSIYALTMAYIANAYFDYSKYSTAQNWYFSLAQLLEKQHKTNGEAYRNVLSDIANNYQELNKYDSSFLYVEKAERLYRTAKDTASSYYFHTQKLLSNCYSNSGRSDTALAIQLKLIDRMKENPYVNYKVYKVTLYAIASYYYNNDRFEEALKQFAYLKNLLEEDHAESTALYGHTLQTIAYIYTRYYTDKNKEAAALFETSVQNKRAAFGDKSETYLHAASDLSRFYAVIKEFEKAIAYGKELLVQIEKTTGKDDPLYAHHSEVLGDIYYAHTDFVRALPYTKTAYDYYAGHKKEYFSEYIDLSLDLARCLAKLYKEEEAENIYLGALQETEKNFGKENIQYVKLTMQLVDLYTFIGRDNSARIHLLEVLPVAKRLTGENGGFYFGYLNRLASIELSLGAYAKSDSLLSILKKISLDYSGTNSESYLIYLKEKANLEFAKENYKEADVYYVHALKLTANLYGTNSEDYAQSLKKTAIFYRNIRRYAESEEMLLKAKTVIEKIYGNKVLTYAYYIDELAMTYYYKGSYSNSEKYYDEAIGLFEKESSKNSWNYLNTVNSKAKMYLAAGLYNKSKETFELYLQAVNGYEGKKGNYALALSEIASLYRFSASYTKAIEYQKESQKILADAYSVEDYRYITGLNMLGLIYLDANKLDSSAYFFNEYKRLVKKLFPGDSTAISLYYNNYSAVCHKKGNFEEAEKLLNTAYKINKGSISKDPTTYINFFDNYSSLYTSWGKLEKAEKYWDDVLPAILNYTTKMFGEFSEQEKAQFWAEYAKDFEIYNSYCLKHRKTKPEVLQKMYDHRIATKAIVLNSINKLKSRIYSSRDSSLIRKYETWQLLKDRTARYYGVSPKQLSDAGIALDSIEKVLERLEKDLNISVEDKKQNKGMAVSWRDIQKRLLPGEAAVEIIRFRDYANYFTDSVVYAALILTPDTKNNPELVMLPSGHQLESRYLSFYKNAIKFKLEDSLSYKVFWQPLEEKLNGISTLYISLDGVYNQLNLNTLLMPGGAYLLDKRKIIIVSNTKDVLNLKSVAQTTKTNASQGVHIFGFPDYDAGMDNLPSKSGNERDINLALDFASGKSITKLPGTKVEMEKIVVLLADKQWKFRSYQFEQATENLVKGLQSPLVLHIATHGFFLGEEQVKLGAGGGGYMAGQKYNPLLMSGLMLTGATKSLLGYATHDDENGILTALEASALNLNNTELVILSACETGKGEIKVGEGVYGLQRAFQVAGAKATIMSLWKVDDNATQQLMESFYRYWMDSGNKTESFRKAQLEVRQKYPSPYYWGAFVMMGE